MFHYYFSFFATFLKNFFGVKTHCIFFSVLVLFVLFILSPQINVFGHAFINYYLSSKVFRFLMVKKQIAFRCVSVAVRNCIHISTSEIKGVAFHP